MALALQCMLKWRRSSNCPEYSDAESLTTTSPNLSDTNHGTNKSGSDSASTNKGSDTIEPQQQRSGPSSTTLKRQRDGNGGMSNDEPDEGNNDPRNPKRYQSGSSASQPSRGRFVCPFEIYDPAGSGWCTQVCPRNPMGGIDTFNHLKYSMP